MFHKYTRVQHDFCGARDGTPPAHTYTFISTKAERHDKLKRIRKQYGTRKAFKLNQDAEENAKARHKVK